MVEKAGTVSDAFFLSVSRLIQAFTDVLAEAFATAHRRTMHAILEMR